MPDTLELSFVRSLFDGRWPGCFLVAVRLKARSRVIYKGLKVVAAGKDDASFPRSRSLPFFSSSSFASVRLRKGKAMFAHVLIGGRLRDRPVTSRTNRRAEATGATRVSSLPRRCCSSCRVAWPLDVLH